MLNPILRLFIVGLLILFLLDGGVFAATVDGHDLTGKAVPSGFAEAAVVSLDRTVQDPKRNRSEPVIPISVGPSIDKIIDKGPVNVFSPAALTDPQATAAPTISPEKRPGLGTIAADGGFILVNLRDTNSPALSWRGVSRLGEGSAGWQILLPSLPDTKFRHFSNAQFSPTFLMFVMGLVGIAFLARCRPRRRGQLGLMT